MTSSTKERTNKTELGHNIVAYGKKSVRNLLIEEVIATRSIINNGHINSTIEQYNRFRIEKCVYKLQTFNKTSEQIYKITY